MTANRPPEPRRRGDAPSECRPTSHDRARHDAASRRDATRAQAHTLEAVAAAVLLLASVVFALQVTAVTPLTASTSSQHIENQQGATAAGVLAATDDGEIEETLLRWNTTDGTFYNTTDDGRYVVGGPPTPFGDLLDRTFRDRGVAYNVNIRYLGSDGDGRSEPMVYFGEPSDHASVATTTVTLRDDDRLLNYDGEPTENRLSNTSYFASDASPETGLYNVVEVEVVVWRM